MDISSEDIDRLLVNNVKIYYIVCVGIGLPKHSRILNTDLRWNRKKIGPLQPQHFQTIIMLNNMKALVRPYLVSLYRLNYHIY